MSVTARSGHLDTFARDHLPPCAQWPDLVGLEALGYPPRLNCAVELLDRAVAEGYGRHPCIITPSVTLSYAALGDVVDRVAHVLVRDLGLVPGERVLLRAPNCLQLAASWLAVVKAGGIAVATMPLLRQRELEFVIEKARVRLALCDGRLTGELAPLVGAGALQELIAFGEGGELEQRMRKHDGPFPALDTAADDVCLIAFTSGTTGVPKATMHFHRDILAVCDTYGRQVLQPATDDVFIGSPPLAFTFGLGGLLLFPLRARAATVLLEDVSPASLRAGIERFRATILFTAPTAYRALVAAADGDDALRSLRRSVSAGEPLPLPVFEDWQHLTGLPILDGIGSTELLHIFIGAPCARIRPGSTGLPVPGYQARVLGADGEM
ncbi:MAG: AMP-binding protein, partial [Gammaproteobacteria bacterium]|nr:AMP-binding protein [Gammaproteobacteria bacterium]